MNSRYIYGKVVSLKLFLSGLASRRCGFFGGFWWFLDAMPCDECGEGPYTAHSYQPDVKDLRISVSSEFEFEGFRRFSEGFRRGRFVDLSLPTCCDAALMDHARIHTLSTTITDLTFNGLALRHYSSMRFSLNID